MWSRTRRFARSTSDSQPATTMRFQRFFVGALAALSLTACAADAPTAPASSGAIRASAQENDGPERYQFTYKLPMVIREFVPCANGGAGEWVAAEGILMDRGQQFQDGAGQLHYRASSTLQMFSGHGETSGDRFTASGGWAIRERIVPGEGDDYVDHRDYRFGFRVTGGGVVLHMQLLLRETYGEGTTPTEEIVVERLTCM
jgi:hypothetical protein